MLAKDNNYISDTASTVYHHIQEEMIRLQCEAREDYYRTQLSLMHEMEKQDAEIEKRDAEIESLSTKNRALSSINHNLASMIQSLSAKKDKLLAWALEHGYQPD